MARARPRAGRARRRHAAARRDPRDAGVPGSGRGPRDRGADGRRSRRRRSGLLVAGSGRASRRAPARARVPGRLAAALDGDRPRSPPDLSASHAVERSGECSPELPYGHGAPLDDVARHFVARDGGALAGHVVLHVEGASGGVYDMGVAPGHRRHGHGTALTLAALAAADELGCTSVTLNATSEGEPLYRSVGFASLGHGMTWWLFPRDRRRQGRHGVPVAKRRRRSSPPLLSLLVLSSGVVAGTRGSGALVHAPRHRRGRLRHRRAGAPARGGTMVLRPRLYREIVVAGGPASRSASSARRARGSSG